MKQILKDMIEKREYSNQFPRKKDLPEIEKLSIKERANFIFSNLEEKMPKLYEYIMNMKQE